MIELDEVSKSFDGQLAVDHVSSRFERGATHVLLGSSGCGKSTILRLVLGLLQPDGGEVRIDGAAMSEASQPELLEMMGYVVQEGGLYPHLSARRNVTLGAEARAWPADRIDARVRELAAMVGFDGQILERYPNQLSGGQRQRVGLMRALMLDPPILLLDEPLAALDPLVRADLQTQLKEIFGRLGKTVLLVTHDIREAVVLGQTITLMTAGRVIQQGTYADLARRPSSPFVTAFLEAQQPPPEMREPV